MQITHKPGDAHGRYVAQIGEGPEAEITYSKANDTLIIIDHTGVPDDYRGQGVGVALVERAVHDARAGGISIVPLCPFVAAQFKRHPEWQDVLSQTMKRKET